MWEMSSVQEMLKADKQMWKNQWQGEQLRTRCGREERVDINIQSWLPREQAQRMNQALSTLSHLNNTVPYGKCEPHLAGGSERWIQMHIFLTLKSDFMMTWCCAIFLDLKKKILNRYMFGVELWSLFYITWKMYSKLTKNIFPIELRWSSRL